MPELTFLSAGFANVALQLKDASPKHTVSIFMV